jgi:serine/threonine-protein kinase
VTEATRLLSGRYELGDVLGRGGMAEVHIGRDTRLGRTVAVKMLRSDLARDPSFQARFRREAHSAASLNHPAVVAVYDTGEDVVDGQPVPYIVMEYVEGSTLRDLLVSGRRLLPERALEIVAGVLSALAYSHRQGIIHRDIKPGNVMLTRTGEVKVMDFGIARAIADTSATMTQTSAVIGTAQYLSPEQARGEQVDARSDLYSTGCLLYELLTGRPPFVGDSPVSVAYQHVRENAAPPSSVDPDVPPAADAITLKALAKDRDLRYQTADEMRSDIERALTGLPVTAPAAALATQAVTPVAAATTTFPMVDDEEPPRKGRGLAYTLLGLAVLAVFVIAALIGRSLFGTGTTQVQVPQLRGLTVAQATEKLTAAGLKLGNQTTVNSDTVKAGLIADQSIESGTSVDEGTAVSVSVSAGAAQTTVPPIIGLSRADAEQALQDANLKVGKVTSKESAKPQNEVLSSSKPEGSTVPAGTAIDLVVASGSNKVPDVRGKNKDEATAILQEAGFEVQSQDQQDGTKPAGTVISQSLAPNSIRRLGSTITITVATPAPTTAPPSETATPSISLPGPSPSG